MKNDPAHDPFRELFWRRDRTNAEQEELREWLATHPDSRMDAEAEDRLNALLNTLPDAPVSSNFTSRVVQAVEREAWGQPPTHRVAWTWTLRSILPRVAMVVTVTCVGIYAWNRHTVAQRAQMAQSVMAVSEVESLPAAAFLEDFEAIRKLGRTAPVDEELLALMQ